MWNIRSGTAAESDALSELALRSKGYWGYSEEFLAACRAELTWTPQECADGRTWVAEMDGNLLGMARLVGQAPHGRLEALFVEPEAIGSGIGAALLRYSLAVAVSAAMTRVELDADPDAEAFYLHHGAVRVGETPSGSVPGRVLPRLAFDLSALVTASSATLR